MRISARQHRNPGRLCLPHLAVLQPLQSTRLHKSVSDGRHAQGRPRTGLARYNQMYRMRLLHHGLPLPCPRIDEDLKRSSKCDGCRERVARGLTPICVEACPLRALDFGTPYELSERHPGTVRSIVPMPDESATSPNLLILPSAAAECAAEKGGSIVNRAEAGL